MDDLIQSFVPPEAESSAEGDYIYHFVDDIPEVSVHGTDVLPIASASAVPSSLDPFFVIETPDSEQTTGGKVEDERDYMADMNNDDIEHEHRVNEGSQVEAHPNLMGSGSGDPGRSSRKLDYPVLNTEVRHPGQSLGKVEYPPLNTGVRDPGQSLGRVEYPPLNTEAGNGALDRSLALSDSEWEEHGFTQNLRRFHRQDSERDELLEVHLAHGTPFLAITLC